MSEPSLARMKELARQHKPRGWKIEWREPHNKHGQFLDDEVGWSKGVACFDRKMIYCIPIIDRYSLAIFLHECGHVHLKHGQDDYDIHYAEMEYEAEMYAIKAMRANGIAVPQVYLDKSRAYVEECIRKTPKEPQTDEVLRYAFGKEWRKHR